MADSRQRLLLMAKAKAKRDRALLTQDAPADTTGVADVQELESLNFESEKTPAKKLQDWNALIVEEKAKAMKKENPIMSKIYPRITQLKAEGNEDVGGQGAMAALGDAMSLPGRVIAAVQDFEGDSWDEKFKNYFESIEKTEGDNIATSILRHPATGAAIALAPYLAPIHAISPVAAGMAEGAGTALISQLDRLGQGQDVSGGEAAVDMAISGLFPGLSAGLRPMKKGMQKTADKIMEGVLKPKKKLTQSIGSKFEVKNIWKHGLDSPMGISTMEKNVKRHMKGLGTEYERALKTIPKDARIDVDGALAEAKKELAEEISAGKYANEYIGVEKGIKYWDDYLESVGKREATVKDALGIRSGVGKMAKYDKLDPNMLKGVDIASAKFYEKINKKLDFYPQIRKVDKKYAESIPLQEAIEDAAPRIRKGFIQSLNDNPALLTMMMGGGLGGATGGATGAMVGTIPGLTMLGATRAAKSPGFASLLNKGGQGLGMAEDIMTNPILQRTVPGLARIPLKNSIGDQ